MVDLTSHMTKATNTLAQRWREYVLEGTNVQPLASSTIYAKAMKGSTYPDTPLIDTGQMLASIGTRVESVGTSEVIGTVEGTDTKWVYHEFGLGVPERPTLRPVFDISIDAILETMADDIFEEIKKGIQKGE
jgi:hypothetical protein